MRFRWRQSHPIVSSTSTIPPPVAAQTEVSFHSAKVAVELDTAVRAAVQNTGVTAAAVALMERDKLVRQARLGDIAPDLGIALK
jgi:hypothetical protein